MEAQSQNKKLEQVFEETAKTGTGSLGIGFRDMNSGETLFYNGDKVFPLASVYKIFILFELFRRQKLGAFSFSDRHTLPEKEKSIGSGILELIGEGASFP